MYYPLTTITLTLVSFLEELFVSLWEFIKKFSIVNWTEKLQAKCDMRICLDNRIVYLAENQY